MLNFCYTVFFGFFLLSICCFLANATPAVNDVIVILDKEGQLQSTPLQIYLRPEHEDFLNDKANVDAKMQMIVNGQRIPLDLANLTLEKQILHSGIEGIDLRNVSLNEGQNDAEIQFLTDQDNSTTTTSEDLEPIPFRIFFWRWHNRLVISDIDGTITRQDLMDILFPSNEWIQTGVKLLYEKIVSQGYKLVFLTARPLSLARHTQNYLNQSGIPPGPVLLSPNSLLANFAVMAKPTAYKVNCLHGVKKLFPRHVRPFQAGMGNAETDKQAYEKAKIPYIFIVNPEGEVSLHYGTNRTEKSALPLELDYTKLAQHVQLYFPKLEEKIN